MSAYSCFILLALNYFDFSYCIQIINLNCHESLAINVKEDRDWFAPMYLKDLGYFFSRMDLVPTLIIISWNKLSEQN